VRECKIKKASMLFYKTKRFSQAKKLPTPFYGTISIGMVKVVVAFYEVVKSN
jgi:hypothetical protein